MPPNLFYLLSMVSALAQAGPLHSLHEDPTLSRRDAAPGCPNPGVIGNVDTCDTAGDGLYYNNTYPSLPKYDLSTLPADPTFTSLEALINQGKPPCQGGGVIENVDNCGVPGIFSLTATNPESQFSFAAELNASDTCPYAVVVDYEWIDGRVGDATLIDIWRDLERHDVKTVQAKAETNLNEMIHELNQDWKNQFTDAPDLYDILEIPHTNNNKLKRANIWSSTVGSFWASAHRPGDAKLILFGYVLAVGGAFFGLEEIKTRVVPTNLTELKNLISTSQAIGVGYCLLILARLQEVGFGASATDKVARFLALLVIFPFRFLARQARNAWKHTKTLMNPAPTLMQLISHLPGGPDAPGNGGEEPPAATLDQLGSKIPPAFKAYTHAAIEEAKADWFAQMMEEGRADQGCPASLEQNRALP